MIEDLALIQNQWTAITADGLFSEKAQITLTDGTVLAVSGIYCSGTYKDLNLAPYMYNRGEQRDYFKLSLSLVDSLDEPAKALVNATLELMDRPSGHPVYRVFEVAGNRGGILSLKLQAIETDEDADEEENG